MKFQLEDTVNDEVHIEVVTVIRLNKRERSKFKKHFNPTGEYVELPFCGMELTTIEDMMETGLVSISHWTDKDSWYTNDEQEIQTLESMTADDILEIKRLVK